MNKPHYTDKDVQDKLESMGFIFEDASDVAEMAINEGFEWNDIECYWTFDED
jgi:hypothetical protein